MSNIPNIIVLKTFQSILIVVFSKLMYAALAYFSHVEIFYLQLSIDYNSRREERYEWETFAPARTNYDVNFLQSNRHSADKSEWSEKVKNTKTAELASERKSKHKRKLRTILSKRAGEEDQDESDEDIQRLLRKKVPVKVLPRGSRSGSQNLRDRDTKMSTKKHHGALNTSDRENERNLIEESNRRRERGGDVGYDNEAVEMDDRTPRIIVDEVDEETNGEVLVDVARNRVSNGTETSEKSRKASATSQLTDGSHRSSVSRRLSSSLRIDIDLDDDPEFQVC